MKIDNVVADRVKLRKVSKRLNEEIAAKADLIVAQSQLFDLKTEIVKRKKARDEFPDVLAQLVEAKGELAEKNVEIKERDDLKESIAEEERILEKKKERKRKLESDIAAKRKEIEEDLILEESELKKVAKARNEKEQQLFLGEKKKHQELISDFQNSQRIEEKKVKEVSDEGKRLEEKNAELVLRLEKGEKELELTDEKIKAKYLKEEKVMEEQKNLQTKKEILLNFGEGLVNEAIRRTNELKLALEKIHGKPIYIQLPQKINFREEFKKSK